MILNKKESLQLLKEMKKNENRKPNKKEKEIIKLIKELEEKQKTKKESGFVYGSYGERYTNPKLRGKVIKKWVLK